MEKKILDLIKERKHELSITGIIVLLLLCIGFSLLYLKSTTKPTISENNKITANKAKEEPNKVNNSNKDNSDKDKLNDNEKEEDSQEENNENEEIENKDEELNNESEDELDDLHNHTHTWIPVISTVHHNEEGHYETIVIKESWSEKIPVYEEISREICNGCGGDFTGHIAEHIAEQASVPDTNCTSSTTTTIQTQVGTNTLNHPAVTDKEWIVDKEAFDEILTIGYECSDCYERQ